MSETIPAEVKEVFQSFPKEAREQLLLIRAMIFEQAEANPKVGPLTETLKWGEPSYLTEKSKSGSTIRIGWKAKKPECVSLFLNCNTSLVETYRQVYDGELTFVGNREISLPIGEPVPKQPLSHCISMALTYHLDNTNGRND